MIHAQKISVQKDGRTIMSIPQLSVEAGQITGLIGPSGSGKTTLLNCLGLLQEIDSGQLLIGGKDYSRPKQRQRLAFWRQQAAFVFQDYGIVEEWTLAQNILIRDRVRAKEVRNLEEILVRVGLAGRARTRALSLSGGEKQRLALARALYRQASYLFVDEPTASLDADNRQKVEELLRAAAVGGAHVLVATHDEGMIAACDSLYRLESQGN